VAFAESSAPWYGCLAQSERDTISVSKDIQAGVLMAMMAFGFHQCKSLCTVAHGCSPDHAKTRLLQYALVAWSWWHTLVAQEIMPLGKDAWS
jgi:hypothetical protein